MYNFGIVPYWTWVDEQIICSVKIKNLDWKLWYSENSRRFHEMSLIPYDFTPESEYRKYIKEFPMFDIDESEILRLLSISHLNEILKFLTK